MERAEDRGRTPDLLVEAYRKGRPGAFDAIVLAHQDRVFSFCVRMLGGDREEARDAAQDVFLSVYRNLGAFRGESALSTWILKIAVNRCLNRIRQRNTRGEREIRECELGDDGVLDRIASPGEEKTPDRAAEILQTGEILRKALGSLDETSRMLVLLGDVEGWSYEELAESAGIPLGTVKSRLHRARMALRKILAPVA